MSRLSACVPALRSILPTLLSRGACLVLPGHEMPVPIPLHECVLRDEQHLLWATSFTPYGPSRPCVGLLRWDDWEPLPLTSPHSGADLVRHEATGGIVLRHSGIEVARIVPFTQLDLPTERLRRLREDQVRHEHRAAREPAYASRWAQRFREASASANRVTSS